MKNMKHILSMTLVAAAMTSLMVTGAQAADYNFTTTAPQDYYNSSSYEDVYGSQYNYGGKNVIDYQVPELEYGVQSTTMTGVMERTMLPGLQQTMATGGSGYGVSGGGPITVLVEAGNGNSGSASTTTSTVPTLPTTPSYQQPAYTSVEGMAYKDGSIGTVKIPSLKINMKVWEGETADSMKKGLGHYSSTSAWNGNVSVCGHNRGSKYVIGSIKDLKQGDTITYTTIYGTRTYQVSTVQIISNTDWSYLQSTADNRITLTTCLADHPESRVCVQAVEVS
ncbi:MAG: sortase [Oscillospiraceae bacterium]|nr:sortase [Oscillospiraceae bacterium]